jgi:hypothetical protein
MLKFGAYHLGWGHAWISISERATIISLVIVGCIACQ